MEQLSLLFLLRGVDGLCGFRLGHALLEFVHAAGGVHELLLAGIERMADVANTDDNHRLGGAGLDHVAAGATDFRIHIFRMNGRLHKKGRKINMRGPDDKTEFYVTAPMQGMEWIFYAAAKARTKQHNCQRADSPE